MPTMPRFHLAFPVDDLTAARGFYGDLLGCPEGRSTNEWVDFNLFGHQIVAHLAPEEVGEAAQNGVDGKAVPVRHFGVLMDWADWDALHTKLTAAGMDYIIAPYVRFDGQPGEQGTFFVKDPSGNALEFKSFKNDEMVFAKSFD
ncbi:MAG: VOC family protein [Devosiaceae bacterium]